MLLHIFYWCQWTVAGCCVAIGALHAVQRSATSCCDIGGDTLLCLSKLNVGCACKASRETLVTKRRSARCTASDPSRRFFRFICPCTSHTDYTALPSCGGELIVTRSSEYCWTCPMHRGKRRIVSEEDNYIGGVGWRGIRRKLVVEHWPWSSFTKHEYLKRDL